MLIRSLLSDQQLLLFLMPRPVSLPFSSCWVCWPQRLIFHLYIYTHCTYITSSYVALGEMSHWFVKWHIERPSPLTLSLMGFQLIMFLIIIPRQITRCYCVSPRGHKWHGFIVVEGLIEWVISTVGIYRPATLIAPYATHYALLGCSRADKCCQILLARPQY